MIGMYQIAQAMRDVDAESEEHSDQERFWRIRGFDSEAIHDCAMQEGLRVVMIEKGMNPNRGPGLSSVFLTQEESMRQVHYAAVWLAGAALMHKLVKTSLEPRLDEIERELDREVHDTHDYSSSDYSAKDDGFNEGKDEALDRVRALLKEQS